MEDVQYPPWRIEFMAIVRRLKCADGHLQKIIEMIEAGKPCVQLAQRLQAVESAIENAKKAPDPRSFRPRS
jgi:DNA-binding FrmR family transcriptional regulator